MPVPDPTTPEDLNEEGLTTPSSPAPSSDESDLTPEEVAEISKRADEIVERDRRERVASSAQRVRSPLSPRSSSPVEREAPGDRHLPPGAGWGDHGAWLETKPATKGRVVPAGQGGFAGFFGTMFWFVPRFRRINHPDGGVGFQLYVNFGWKRLGLSLAGYSLFACIWFFSWAAAKIHDGEWRLLTGVDPGATSCHEAGAKARDAIDMLLNGEGGRYLNGTERARLEAAHAALIEAIGARDHEAPGEALSPRGTIRRLTGGTHAD